MELNPIKKSVNSVFSGTSNQASAERSNIIASGLEKETNKPRFHSVPSDNFCQALYHHALGQDDLALRFLVTTLNEIPKILETSCFDKATTKNLKDLLSRTKQIHDSISKGNEVLNLSTNIAYMSSKKNDLIFLPWVYDTDKTDFSSTLIGDNFRDLESDKYQKFLPKQDALLKGWYRPSECPEEKFSMGYDESNALYQEALNNCSFVSSLCSIMAYNRRMSKQRIYPKLYPQDENGLSMLSASGKYVCKMFFNGVNRKVIIDDYLPISNMPGHSLYVKSANTPGLLWPALLEKAYMKVMGGYDFKGSYAASDTFSIIGWIPEIILLSEYFQSGEFNTRKKLWSRLWSSWEYGDVLLCLGTGKFLSSIGLNMGLIPEHDYAIVDLKEEIQQDGTMRQSILLQNPWNTVAPLSENEATLNKHTDNITNGTGKFWISFESACFEFQSLYLNWNPALFAHQESTHFLWDDARCASKNNMIYQNPQYTVTNNGEREVTIWLLLCRHSHTSKTHDTTYITIHLYESNGSKIYTPDEKPIHTRGTSMNTPYYLLPFTLPSRCSYTAVVSVSNFDQSNNETRNTNILRFSLLTYSTSKNIKVEKSKHELPYRALINGEWNSFTAGGSWSTTSYSSNPQFQLTLSEPTTDLRVYLSSECDSAISVQLFYTPKGTVFSFDNKLIIGASDNYKQHNVFMKHAKVDPLLPGKYTIIPSTFDTGAIGKFRLMCFSDQPISINALPGIMAGLFLRQTKKSWNNDKVIRIPFYLKRNGKVIIHVSTNSGNDGKSNSSNGTKDAGSGSNYRPSIKVSLFSPESELVAVSSGGNYSDTIYGLFLDVDIHSRKLFLNGGLSYTLIVERLVQGNDDIDVTIGSEIPVELDI